MKKENFKKIVPDTTLVKQKSHYFLGKVILHDVSKKIKVKEQKVYFVRFKNGAKTKLHYHQGAQILVVTEGKGALAFYQKHGIQNNKVRIKLDSKSKLKVGDVVYIPKGVLHWHGATGRNNFSHIAFNAFTKEKESKTFWYNSNFVSVATKIP